MTIVDIEGILSTHPFLKGLPDEWLGDLADRAASTVWPTGHRIFDEGRTADSFWLIRHGLVALDLHVPGRGDVVIETLGPDTVLGWSWLFPPHVWHFGAFAVQETHALEFDAAGVLGICDRDPALGYDLSRRFMGVLLDRLQNTRLRLLDLYGPDAQVAQ
jgi:CRP-like cAMP-binding protein